LVVFKAINPRRSRVHIKTILNHVQKHRSFVYGAVTWSRTDCGERALEVELRARRNGQPVCSGCGRKGTTYDHLSPRRFEFVPLWGIMVFLVYAMRRVSCTGCGVTVERVPWALGKRPVTKAYAWFLASWAKRLSWSETARVFKTSWETVFRSVGMAVAWGRANMDLTGITALGVDEILWQRGHKYLTVVYQIDESCKRLLWVGEHRTTKTFLRFFRWFGPERSRLIEFVCSDMWKPYLKVIARKAGQAVHVLDRFHIMQHLSKAIDEVRAKEAKKMTAAGYEPVLKRTRWCLLKRPENLTEKQEVTLAGLLQYNLKTVRAYLLKEDFQGFWDYVMPYWAGQFLDRWCTRTMRSRLEPMKKVARMLRNHRELILNWFRARGAISAATVEGFNNKAKLTTRKAYGFRTFRAAEIGLYHALGNLPEPEMTHRFC
jgi:transposase